MINHLIKFFLEHKLLTLLVLLAFVVWGLITAPFQAGNENSAWHIPFLPSDPVAVDAIPDIGENQQIVFTEWEGKSPQDIEDQISYPLTSYLLGLPSVKSVRSTSIFGFSSIYLIFDEEADFYWSRTRILEKLNALPPGLLPEGVQPTLGPDATGLGQVFWYTLEGRDQKGNTTGGWDLQEVRSVQDFYVKYALNATEGVAEVASIGGFVKEYHIDVKPDILQQYDITLTQVIKAVRSANKDVGAQTMEINQAEYLIRGLGNIENLEDIEQSVVSVFNNVPIRLQDVAHISVGPATRRGVLDKDGAEVVGGVVVARYGANPLEVIEATKQKIKDIASGLPKKTLADGTVSQLTLVPFYDRSELIYETLGTLEQALSLQVLITIIVILVMVYHLRASFLIAALLPIGILMVFIAMRYFEVDANIVALSGIAIAIGTMVDLGVILTENILKRLDEIENRTVDYYQKVKQAVYEGSAEVSSAIITAVATTIVSFIPVFTLQAAEGKLFTPLAFTKTFALVAALMVTLLILPALAHWFFGWKFSRKKPHAQAHNELESFVIKSTPPTEEPTTRMKVYGMLKKHGSLVVVLLGITYLLTTYWLPLGPSAGFAGNLLFVIVCLVLILGFFKALTHYYQSLLHLCLRYKKTFLTLPFLLILLGVNIWLGFPNVFGFVAKGFDALGTNIRTTHLWSGLTHSFPGLQSEFMPALDEGSFLLMPTSMPHSGVEYNTKVLAQLDMQVAQIPEVERVVGKLGRVNSALDPAPVSMFENVIQYKPEYISNSKGRPMRFATQSNGYFVLKDLPAPWSNTELLFNPDSYAFESRDGQVLSDRQQDELFTTLFKDIEKHLVPKNKGDYFRNWRPQIASTDDIWDEISKQTQIPGVTSAPKLQPIETRLVMLQTGMRAPMGIKVYGPDLETIAAFGEKLEGILKTIPSVKAEATFADRVIGKPYLNLELRRPAMARYGLTVEDVQQVITTAIGGNALTTTLEGRERYAVRVRYPRELRDSPEALENITVNTPMGKTIPLSEVVTLHYERGPQAIKSEDSFLVSYVIFDKKEGFSEVEVVETAQSLIDQEIAAGSLQVPAGVSFQFSGTYENQVRAEKRLSFVVPVVLAVIFLILYFQFKSIATAMMVFSGVAMAFSGGFIMLWLYGQPGFQELSVLGFSLSEVFHIQPFNLSVAVWVGFIALFGLATDDGVLMGTYLDQRFKEDRPKNIKGIRMAVVEAGARRIRPAVMTSATTLIALLPILSSSGRGADIMIPMAIPAFGGMLVAAITYFVVPVLYCWRLEARS